MIQWTLNSTCCMNKLTTLKTIKLIAVKGACRHSVSLLIISSSCINTSALLKLLASTDLALRYKVQTKETNYTWPITKSAHPTSCAFS